MQGSEKLCVPGEPRKEGTIYEKKCAKEKEAKRVVGGEANGCCKNDGATPYISLYTHTHIYMYIYVHHRGRWMMVKGSHNSVWAYAARGGAVD